MKLGHHKVTKVTEPDFWKQNLGGHKWGKTPFWGHFWCYLSISLHPVIKIFWNFIYMISSLPILYQYKLEGLFHTISFCEIKLIDPCLLFWTFVSQCRFFWIHFNVLKLRVKIMYHVWKSNWAQFIKVSFYLKSGKFCFSFLEKGVFTKDIG